MIQITPTFLWDEIEVPYDEGMKSFIQAVATDSWKILFNIIYSPCISQNHYLLRHWCNYFTLLVNVRLGFRSGQNHWVVVSWCSLDTALTADSFPYLRSVYITMPYLWSTLYLPPGVSILISLPVFYSHNHMMTAESYQGSVFCDRVV